MSKDTGSSSAHEKATGLILALVLVAWGATAIFVASHPLPPERPGQQPWQQAEPEQPPPIGAGDNHPTGYVPNPAGRDAFLRSLDKPTIREAGPELFRDPRPRADKEPTLLYPYLHRAYLKKTGKPWVVGAQGIGDCVSWGWAHGTSILMAVDLEQGRTGEWREAATEPIYGGSRVEARGRSSGGWGDGSYGAAAAKWCRDWGILFRQEYPGVDLSTYSSQRAKQWGNYGNGGQGDNGKLDAIAKEHPVKTVALCTTFTEAAAAIESGYPVPVCSGQGFKSTRDAQGFAAPSGSWSHCMVFIGVRWDRPGLLCLNSWGPSWIRGPPWPADQPDGSFWVDEKVVNRMLAGRDSFALSGLSGFPRRKLKHGEGL